MVAGVGYLFTTMETCGQRNEDIMAELFEAMELQREEPKEHQKVLQRTLQEQKCQLQTTRQELKEQLQWQEEEQKRTQQEQNERQEQQK